jgi:hypothetical protein
MSILELKIVLLDTKPSVYRIIHIENTRTFYDLHLAIQIAFGWEDYHLHEFRLNDEVIGTSDFIENQKFLEESNTLLLQKIVSEKQEFFYNYDFGDNWEHKIKLVKFIEPKNTFYPRCVKGARNTPPEDCGGVWGFEEFKEIMGDKKHPDYKEMKKWYGALYDEDFFNLSLINNNFKDFENIKNISNEDVTIK